MSNKVEASATEVSPSDELILKLMLKQTLELVRATLDAEELVSDEEVLFFFMQGKTFSKF